MDERTEQRWVGGIELGKEIRPAATAHNRFVDPQKDLFDLLVQLGAVGDDEDTGVGDIFAQPLGEPDHGQTFAAALGVPEDAPFALTHPRLRCLDAKVLVVATELFGAAVKDSKVVDQFQQARLVAELNQMTVERARRQNRGGVFLFPGEVIFLAGFDGAVAQPFAVIAGQHQLHGGEEGLDKELLLVVEILANAFADGNGGALEFQHPQRNAVDIEDDIGALGVGAFDRHLFGQGKVVLQRILPVDQPDGLAGFTGGFLHRDAIAQEAIDRFVTLIEAAALVVGSFAQFMERFGDERFAIAARPQHRAQKLRLNVAVVGPLRPVAQIVIAQHPLKELHNPILGFAFGFAHVAHGFVCPFPATKEFSCQSSLSTPNTTTDLGSNGLFWRRHPKNNRCLPCRLDQTSSVSQQAIGCFLNPLLCSVTPYASRTWPVNGDQRAWH